MLFSAGFLFALLLSFSEARCRLGFRRRIDAAISRTASKAKTPSQSSEHGVVATGKHHASSSSFADVNYSNFKHEVAKRQGQKRSLLYHEVWDVLYRLQTDPAFADD